MSSIYRRPNKPGGVYYLDYYVAGKRLRRSLETTREKTAKERKEAIDKGEIDLKWGRGRRDVKFADFWALGKDSQGKDDPAKDKGKYIEWAQRHKSKNSIARERINYAQFLEFAQLPKFGSVSPATVEEFKAHLADTRKQSPQTINDALVRMSGLYGHARALCGYGQDNPFQAPLAKANRIGAARLPVPEKAVRYLTPEQADKVMAEAEDYSPEIHIFCALCLYAGMRSGEAVNSEWSWFNFDTGVITVQNAHQRFTTKSGRIRTVPLHSKLRAILEPLRADSGYLIKPLKTAAGKWRLRYEPKRPFRDVVTAAGVDWCTPHILRHSFASLLVQSGVSLYKVSVWLGHRDIETTKIYSHLAARDEDIDRL